MPRDNLWREYFDHGFIVQDVVLHLVITGRRAAHDGNNQPNLV